VESHISMAQFLNTKWLEKEIDMGGKNHQPCNKLGTGYLIESAKLSMQLSKSLEHLELANVELEDVLLGEIENQKSNTLGPVVENLEISKVHLVAAIIYIDALNGRMDKFNFQDLPTLGRIDLNEIGEALSQQGVVRKESWDIIRETMESGGFIRVLKIFKVDVRNMAEQTIELKKAIEMLEQIA